MAYEHVILNIKKKIKKFMLLVGPCKIFEKLKKENYHHYRI